MNGSGISWPIYKFAPQSTQITTPAPHHSVFYRPNALPAAQPTTLKHWMQKRTKVLQQNQLSSQNSQRLKLKTCYLATYFDCLHTAGNTTTAWCSLDLLWTAYCTCICTQQSQTYTRSQKTKTLHSCPNVVQTLPNVNRFSKFFHHQTQQQICNSHI